MAGQQIAVISLEGVLRAEGTGAPITAGVALYRALSAVYTTAVSTVVGPSQPVEELAAWMTKAGLQEHQYAYASVPEVSRTVQLDLIRGQGNSVALWVDSDPLTVTELSRRGVPALLFLHPAYARPEHRPDYEGDVTPWDELVGHINDSWVIRAKDTRLVSE